MTNLSENERRQAEQVEQQRLIAADDLAWLPGLPTGALLRLEAGLHELLDQPLRQALAREIWARMAPPITAWPRVEYKGYPDLERVCDRLYHESEQREHSDAHVFTSLPHEAFVRQLYLRHRDRQKEVLARLPPPVAACAPVAAYDDGVQCQCGYITRAPHLRRSVVHPSDWPPGVRCPLAASRTSLNHAGYKNVYDCWACICGFGQTNPDARLVRHR